MTERKSTLQLLREYNPSTRLASNGKGLALDAVLVASGEEGIRYEVTGTDDLKVLFESTILEDAVKFYEDGVWGRS